MCLSGLMSDGPVLDDSQARLAVYVDKIRKGAKPADLPVEQPTKLEMVVNRKTAKAFGLEIPPGLILRDDVVISHCTVCTSFAAVHESASGLELPSRNVCSSVANGGEAENICSM
jgi:hypothetical protein